MKKLIMLTTLLLMSSPFAQMGFMSAINDFVDDTFISVQNISEPYFLSDNSQCSERVSILVTGNRGSGTTAHDCTLCLVNEGSLVSVDESLSDCYREGH